MDTNPTPESSPDAIEKGLVSGAVDDSGGFPANLVDVLDKLATSVQHIADAINRVADIAKEQRP